MLDKADRIKKIVAVISSFLGLGADEVVYALRAAHLCKADLVTRMVVEMTSLQGIMGAEYANRNHEHQSVVEAIASQYQPVPGTLVGVVVALADRLDSLTGLFAAGLLPSATKDPFGLRRAALGVVQPLMEHGISLDLREAIQAAADQQPVSVSSDVCEQVLDFIVGRQRVLLLDSGFRYDVVDAVLSIQGHDPQLAKLAVEQLSSWVERKDWGTILPGFSRCVRITRDQGKTFELHSEKCLETAEKELLNSLLIAESTDRGIGSVNDFLNAFLPMLPLVNRYFDSVMVMSEDLAIRENRLALLQRIVRLADGVADLSRLEGF
jgi:glycyl-tRNA synthetase